MCYVLPYRLSCTTFIETTKGNGMKTLTMNEFEAITQDGTSRQWFTLNSTEYALHSDGSILDEDGFPLADGDAETIAVRSAIASM